MLIVGAKGFAKEVLHVLNQKNETAQLFFFDDVSKDIPDVLYGKFSVLKRFDDVQALFKVDPRFTLGLGGPLIRKKLYEKFAELGGQFISLISPTAEIGEFGNEIGKGVNIMGGVIITNDVKVGNGVLINLNCTIGHDSIIGDFVEMSPGVHVSGNCQVGSFCNIGTNAVILPKVKLGNNVIVGAGAVVVKDIPDNTTVVGIPAKPLIK